MKKYFALVAIAMAALFTMPSCTKTDESGSGSGSGSGDTPAPVYEVKVPIITATAVNGDYTCDGLIDNEAKTIVFAFENPGVDLSQLTVTLTFAAKATARDFTEPTLCDLSDGKTVTCTVNNQKADVTYTLSATASANPNPVTQIYAITLTQGTVDATVDNVAHTALFEFLPGQVEITAVDVVIVLGVGVTSGTGCFEEESIDLSNEYKFTVNDGLDDVEYTITAHVASASLVPSENCSVLAGIEGAAPASDPQNISDGYYVVNNSQSEWLNDPANLFDGLWLSGAEKWGELDYHYFGQGTGTAAPTWFIFEIGEPRQVESVTIMPYYPYNYGNCASEYEFYAYKGSGVPTGWSAESEEWTLVAKENICTEGKDWWVLQNAYKSGQGEDPCVNGCNTKFDSEAPVAQYYCWNMVTNFYMSGHGPESDAPSWYAGRAHWFSMSEFLVYAY